MKLSDNSILSESINISGSDMDNSRSKPYRIRIPTGTTKRHEKSFESSASETEIKLNASHSAKISFLISTDGFKDIREK